MLDVTRASRFSPGSNVKGDIRGANWVLLMNRLELRRVLFLSAPNPAALSMISTLAEDVMVWEPNAARRRQLQHWALSTNRTRVTIAERPQAAWRLNESRLDLLVHHAGGTRWPLALLRDSVRAGEQVYVETVTPFGRNAWASKMDRILGQIRAPLRLWLTPLVGEIRSAVPANDSGTGRYFLRHGMCGDNVRWPGLKRAERALARNGFGLPLTRRIGILHRGTLEGDLPPGTHGGRHALRRDVDPPLYLRELALRSGLEIGEYRWGLWARGDYRSQKALFFLFDPKSREPRYVVKMVRDPEFNARLENEYRALQRLEALGGKHREHVPQAVFMGHPGRLAAVGESAIEGAPFQDRTSGGASCRFVHEAVTWLTQLGEATARPTHPGHVGEALHDLYERFCSVYEPTPPLRVFLRQQVERLASNANAIPVVFQHGDPGVWNVVVGTNGRVVFMDWEAAEMHGMPLWDLFYFLRSYVMLSRVRGLRSRAETFASHFLDEGSLSSLIHEATASYCARVGVDASLVEPLFFTCWMHRALKESNRLSAERLARGRFLEVLQLCMERRNAPGLQRLFRADQRNAA